MLSCSPRAHFHRTLFRYEAPNSLSKWALQASGSGLRQELLRVVHLPPTLSERKRLLHMLKDISAVLINRARNSTFFAILEFFLFLNFSWILVGSESPLVLNYYPLRKEGWQTCVTYTRNQLLVSHVNLLRNPYSCVANYHFLFCCFWRNLGRWPYRVPSPPGEGSGPALQ